MANHYIKSETGSREIVLSCIKALNNEDFKTARTYVSDDMKFIGVLGSRDGADAYFNDMERMRLKYRIQKVLADDNDVCIFYDLEISGKTIFGCGWYHLENGKIDSLKVVFDPRPLLDGQGKN